MLITFSLLDSWLKGKKKFEAICKFGGVFDVFEKVASQKTSNNPKTQAHPLF